MHAGALDVMQTRYIFRMDDITPTMNWSRFNAYLDLFKRYDVKPLLGIIPDNKDKDLKIERANHDFWRVMRDLHENGRAEFAQHGYQHQSIGTHEGILTKKYGLSKETEFAGLSYEQQLEKIQRGKEIMERNGIATSIWIAPYHSFDINTLRALRDSDFIALSDGIAMFPYKENGIMFVPQQLWMPKTLFHGIFTVCIHANNDPDHKHAKIEEHLRCSNSSVIPFSAALAYEPTLTDGIMNLCFSSYFRLSTFLGGYLRGGR